MSCNVEKVINIARAEKGYLEKATKDNLDSKTANAGSNNFTKYARDLDNVSGFYNGRKQGYAWCDVFVDWCFVKAYGVSNAKRLLCQPNKSSGAGCKYSMQYYQNKGQFYTTPAVGDQIFFSGTSEVSHTGLVYKVDSSYVYTVEGNTSSEAGVVANGGCVAEKKYRRNYERIVGYGRPKYDAASSEVVEEPVKETPSEPSSNTPNYQCIHVVAKGEILGRIARKYGVTVRSITKLNNIKNPNYIRVGQKIKIPNKES